MVLLQRTGFFPYSTGKDVGGGELVPGSFQQTAVSSQVLVLQKVQQMAVFLDWGGRA
jgi:hypothetical protein